MIEENDLYKTIRKIIKEMNEPPLIFLVGGKVRDEYTGKNSNDFDFMIDGEMDGFVSRFADAVGSIPRRNKKLMTATFSTEWGQVDFARSRKEKYSLPGSLPKVEMSKWMDDLKRRDFTMNAMAIPLVYDGWGDLQDPFNGVGDIEKRLIRMLHANSFRDDPTRILRALRYKTRLGFSIEENTKIELCRGWKYLSNVSPARRLKEWKLICQEEEVPSILQDIFYFGGWRSFFSNIPYRNMIDAAGIINDIGKHYGRFRKWIYLLLEILNKSPENLQTISVYWGLSVKEKKELSETIFLALKFSEKKINYRAAAYYAKRLPLEGLIYLSHLPEFPFISWQEFRKCIDDFKMPINGNDLLELGYVQGREIHEKLEILKKLYIEGIFNTKQEGLILLNKNETGENQHGFY